MDNSKNRQQNDLLGVNKIGKNIRKSPLHQPNFVNNANRQQPQPQVYNISKNDFRNVVQQLTGSPSQEPLPLPRPPQNPPKPQSMRLQKIRPPPLTPVNRPHIPPPAQPPAPLPPPAPFNNHFGRPGQFGQQPPPMMPPMPSGDTAWANTAESPISAYMRYLQTSIMEPSPRGLQTQPSLQQPQAQGPGYYQPQPPPSGLHPNPHMPALPSPRYNGPVPPFPNHPSPQMNGPGGLPSPTSQFLLPSPTAYMNLLSPRSPYPLFSPGMQFPPPLTPNFSFSPMAQSGFLGSGPQPPPSPGLVFPLSPTGFFPLSSPRWMDHQSKR
ncbi:protein HAIKU1 [Mercurialis annua]|uniref:protein HAIKU1 n=1 Tax=Mercurialis annua TaxID=3986 RepID=UPI00215F617C|nr:protein HAIKU1 [Mercurialis annua]